MFFCMVNLFSYIAIQHMYFKYKVEALSSELTPLSSSSYETTQTEQQREGV